MSTVPSRDELAERYLDQLRFDPYPVQEEALLAWFSSDQGGLVCAPTRVGLLTGNRRENPNAPVLVVVAEILFNRLLHPEAFDFSEVGAVVMDEFHSFNDWERGIVWGFSLGL